MLKSVKLLLNSEFLEHCKHLYSILQRRIYIKYILGLKNMSQMKQLILFFTSIFFIFFPEQEAFASKQKKNEQNKPVNKAPIPQKNSNPPPIDLDQHKPQDFFLTTKEIKIPDFPEAFNASITKWQGNYLLCFRLRLPKERTTHQIGLVWLDKEFNVISKGQLIYIPNNWNGEDARIITIRDRVFIIYNDFLPGYESFNCRRMCLTEIHFDGVNFSADPMECLSSYEGVIKDRVEKNWVPFEYEGNLLLAYSLAPHRIMRLLGQGKCETYASTKGSIQWDFGELRGGTPAVIDDNCYISFFHSRSRKTMKTIQSEGKKLYHFFMGAYTFSLKPPFEITRVSPEPIWGRDFYKDNICPDCLVVYPGGLIVDEQFYWVIYGRKDSQIWVAQLDKKGLLNSLVPVITTTHIVTHSREPEALPNELSKQ